ncbi:hypothetical protein ff3pr_01553 [Weissella cibaria]|nr:hypothetical protein ff3pr_01553 [Weissella cibaria]
MSDNYKEANYTMEKLNDLASDAEIAEALGVKVQSTKGLIRRHTERLLLFGNLYVKNESSASGQTIKTYLLNELQQHFIFSIARPINRNGEEIAKANKVVEIGCENSNTNKVIVNKLGKGTINA